MLADTGARRGAGIPAGAPAPMDCPRRPHRPNQWPVAAYENAISAAALHLCEGGHKALFDVRTTLGVSVAELAMRASLTEDDIECIEEGGTSPSLLRRLAAALNADVHLTADHDLGSVWFETHAA